MPKNKNQSIIKSIEKVLNDKVSYKKGDLFHIVSHIVKKSKAIKNLANRNKTPFYAFDQQALDNSIDIFLKAFQKEISPFKAYYAIKINHNPLIVKRAVDKGMGLDVGSPREIDIAINAGCKDIVYFSPGKTKDDLLHALKYADVITINIDSFNELKKLGSLTNNAKKKIKRPYYSVYVYGLHNVKRLADLLNFVGKKSEKINHIRGLENKANPNLDLIPEINAALKALVKFSGIKLKRFRKISPKLAAYYENRCLPSRQGLLEVLSILPNTET